MTSTLFTTFIRLFAFAAGLIALAATLETWLAGKLPKGTLLCLIEFTVGVGTAAWTYRSPLPNRRRFAHSILFIAFADALFYLFNYYLQENLSTNVSAPLISCLYGCGFLWASYALSRATGIQWKDYRKVIVPAITILITFLYYFLPTMIQTMKDHTSLSQHLFNGIILALNIGVATIALTVLTQSMNSFLVFFSLGFTILPLLNFSITSEIFSHGNLSFGFYEYFWAFGVFMAEGALLFLMDELDVKRDQRLSLVSQTSIGVQYKTAIITSIMIALMGSSLISGSSISIKVVTFGIVAGIIFAVLVSSFTVETVSRYSSALGKYLQQGFTSDHNDHPLLERLPVELEVLFSSVFAQTLEKERDRQKRASKYNELYQKFAHDIRSPLQALSNLLQHMDPRDQQAKEACLEAIQSMNRSSQKILDDLEIGAKENAMSITAMAISIPETVQRTIRIFESSLGASKKIELQSTIEPNCKYAWMDESTLERILLNILTNAAESPGASRVSLTARRDRRQIVIEVIDNGQGASRETIERLNQGDLVTTKSKGHGIGLSAHRHALAEAGGSIHFESEPGAFFKVTISLLAGSEKIVLIDDDRAIHLAWSALAKSKGVDLLTLGPDDDFNAKLSALRDSNPEIYIDYHLGHRSGIEVIEQLSSNGFENLFLATSDQIESVVKEQWRIRDKTFPR